VPLRVDYDAIAGAYDRRYQHNDFSGIERAVTSFVGTKPGGRVVEVGCGTGRWLQLLRARGTPVVGMDASFGMLSHARAPILQALAEQLPFPSRSIDRVFCVNAFQHFADKMAFLGEARRVLRPGGRLMTIGLDPHLGIDRWYIYDYFASALDLDRSRYVATSQIKEWMQAVGFTDCEAHEVQHVRVNIEARTALEQGRLERNAASQLALQTDEEYQRGMERLRTDIERVAARGASLELTADLHLYATFGSVA
jgi:ubiquinone/menaquinone biosynthesis C-methylase UbiE